MEELAHLSSSQTQSASIRSDYEKTTLGREIPDSSNCTEHVAEGTSIRLTENHMSSQTSQNDFRVCGQLTKQQLTETDKEEEKSFASRKDGCAGNFSILQTLLESAHFGKLGTICSNLQGDFLLRQISEVNHMEQL